jgi:adenylate cyclase
LRAATSLAQLWAVQGRASQAQQMLGEIYDWFREGFDTPDLQKANHLLRSFEI